MSRCVAALVSFRLGELIAGSRLRFVGGFPVVVVSKLPIDCPSRGCGLFGVVGCKNRS